MLYLDRGQSVKIPSFFLEIKGRFRFFLLEFRRGEKGSNSRIKERNEGQIVAILGQEGYL